MAEIGAGFGQQVLGEVVKTGRDTGGAHKDEKHSVPLQVYNVETEMHALQDTLRDVQSDQMRQDDPEDPFDVPAARMRAQKRTQLRSESMLRSAKEAISGFRSFEDLSDDDDMGDSGDSGYHRNDGGTGNRQGFKSVTKRLYDKAGRSLHHAARQTGNAAAGQPSRMSANLAEIETALAKDRQQQATRHEQVHLNRTDSSSSAKVRPPPFHSYEQAAADRARQNRTANAARRSIRHDEGEHFPYDSSIGSSQAFYDIPPPHASNASGYPFGLTSPQPSSFSMAHQPFFQAPMSSFPPSTSGYMSGIQGPSLSHVGSFDNQRSSATMPESLSVNWRDPFNLNASSSSGTHRPLRRNNPFRQSSPPDEASGYYPSSGPSGSGHRPSGF